jgi:hypothetical protein
MASLRPAHKAHTQVMHMPLANPALQYSPGSIASAQSPAVVAVAYSPPAAYVCARLLCLPRLRVCHGFCPEHKTDTATKAHAKPLRNTLLSTTARRGTVATTAAGTRRRRSRLCYSAVTTGTAKLLLAAGAITFFTIAQQYRIQEKIKQIYGFNRIGSILHFQSESRVGYNLLPFGI